MQNIATRIPNVLFCLENQGTQTLGWGYTSIYQLRKTAKKNTNENWCLASRTTTAALILNFIVFCLFILGFFFVAYTEKCLMIYNWKVQRTSCSQKCVLSLFFFSIFQGRNPLWLDKWYFWHLEEILSLSPSQLLRFKRHKNKVRKFSSNARSVVYSIQVLRRNKTSNFLHGHTREEVQRAFQWKWAQE